MYNKHEILEIAKTQLATDYGCTFSDFENGENILITEKKLLEGRRIYKSDGCFFKMVCLGNNAIISTSPEIIEWCRENFLNRDTAWLFQYPKLRMIDQKLQEFGHEIADIHQYYLPNECISKVPPATDAKCYDAKSYDIKWYEYEDIFQFQNDDRFGEAFAFDNTHPDVLAVAAFDGDKIMGMAGASADSKTMWQIGIDILPEYRSRGLGTNLVKLLRNEILKRGKVPFYGTAQSHFKSQNIAINSGFFPAWAELYSKQGKS